MHSLILTLVCFVIQLFFILIRVFITVFHILNIPFSGLETQLRSPSFIYLPATVLIKFLKEQFQLRSIDLVSAL